MTVPAMQTETFFSHIDSFFDYRKEIYEVSDQTTRSNRIDLHLFKEFTERGKYDSITGPVVMKYQVHLKTERMNAGSSINRKIFTLRSYGQYLNLSDVEGADKLPFRDILKIRGGYKNSPQALSVDQIKILFESIERSTYLEIRDYCVYALMYNLGLRIGEVYSIDLEDVDSVNRKIIVIGKGKKKRILPLTDEMMMIINDWLAVRQYFLNSEELHCFFVSKKGNRLSIRTMEDNFNKILSGSGISTFFKATCHTLRHSFASHLNDEEVIRLHEVLKYIYTLQNKGSDRL
ncbi:Tyrosine recombinase XerC [subsurface metagenome]